jgi:hypothetical protein
MGTRRLAPVRLERLGFEQLGVGVSMPMFGIVLASSLVTRLDCFQGNARPLKHALRLTSRFVVGL